MCFSLLLACPCLACCAGSAYKINKKVSKVFDPPANEQPTESALSTELKLKWKLWNSSPAQEEAPVREAARKPARALSTKEAESKARLQQLIDENKRSGLARQQSSRG